jgi:hypothetical protein
MLPSSPRDLRSFSLLRAVVSASIACASCAAAPSEDAPSPQHVASSSQAIRGGKTESGHPEVLLFARADAARTSIEEACTAVLVAPRIALTAAHCVGQLSRTGGAACEAEGGRPPTTLASVAAPTLLALARDEVAYDSEAWRGTTPMLAVKRVHVVPDAKATVLCGNDLAVVELASPFDAVSPAPLRLDAPVAVGEALEAVGYGVDLAAGSDGRRRSLAGVKVEAIGDVKKPSGATLSTGTEWVVDRGPCAGDSGSPAFDAEGRVVGILSRGDQSTCQRMVYARLDAGGHAAWLAEVVREISTRTGDALPAWATYEPGSAPTPAAPTPDGAAAPAAPSASPATPSASTPGGCHMTPGRAQTGSLASASLTFGILGAVVARTRRRRRAAGVRAT